ncbi:MAG: peptidyl-prolyl cis-trans isomerase [Acidobacteriota bacterium]
MIGTAEPSEARSPWLTALVYLALGGLLYAFLNSSIAPSGDEELVISAARQAQLRADFEFHRQRQPTEQEMAELLEEAIDEELLIHEALRRGLLTEDPLLQRRLASLARFAFAAEQGTPTAEPEESEELLRQRAEESVELGLHRRDPVARDRLAVLARYALSGGDVPFERSVSDQELEDYLRRHAETLSRSPRAQLEQITFVGPDALARATDYRQRLMDDQPAPAEAGDPTPQPRSFPWLTAEDLQQRFGEEFSQALQETLHPWEQNPQDAGATSALPQLPRWIGPVPSTYGFHWVRLLEVRPAGLPPLDEVRDQLVIQVREEGRAEALAEALARLRRNVPVVIEPLDQPLDEPVDTTTDEPTDRSTEAGP